MLQTDPDRTWTTLEDEHLTAIQALRAKLRPKPLLPPPLQNCPEEMSDCMAGVAYPATHCAFAECTWCSDAEPCVDAQQPKDTWSVRNMHWHCSSGACCGRSQDCLWAHLINEHPEAFERCPGDIPSAYIAALNQAEEETVPAVGWSVDRRALRRLHRARNEDNCVALICSCCAAVLPSGPRSDIAYLTVKGLFEKLTSESFSQNWDLAQYKVSYGTHASVRTRLVGSQWQRKLPPSLCKGQAILCCPEDHVCRHCTPGNIQLCEDCELPLCRSCWSRMRQPHFSGVPQALANDNWYGYPLELLYTHKVRWIEAAAACPLWTSPICFYLEADRGHIMEEELHRADHRIAIRGNVSAVSMPWEEIYSKFKHFTAEQSMATLPHSLDALQNVVRITIKGMRHSEIVDWVAGAKLRPWVVVALLEHLVDMEHPMFATYDGTPAELKEYFRTKTQAQYGTKEVSAVAWAAASQSEPAPPQTKNATPDPASFETVGGEAFQGALRPSTLTADWSAAQLAEPTTQEVTQLAQFNSAGVTVETGKVFWDQWQTQYLAWAYPFSIPAPVGGPDFPRQRTGRPRRHSDAPVLGPIAHLRALTRRVESSIRNSWDLISGLRRLTFKWKTVCEPQLWRRYTATASIKATPPAAWVQAAKGLNQKLQKGMFIVAGNRLKPIQLRCP